MRFLSALLTFTFCIGISAQEPSKWEMLDNYLNLLEENNRFMGSLCIYKGDELQYERYLGYSSIEENKRANYQTKYRTGSVTNLFTAALIFQLVEEQKLSLKAPLSDFYPQITNSHKINIADLLNHQSGLHDYTAHKKFSKQKNRNWSKGELMNIIAGSPIDFEPGDKAKFSNTNYLILGFILERLRDDSYSMVLEDKICKPNILTNTKYGGRINTNMYEAHSYLFKNNSWEKLPQTDMSITRGSGAIISTARDLNVFIQKLFRRKIINDVSLDSLLSTTNKIGHGIFEYEYKTMKAWGHSGNIDGFQSHLSYFPEDSVSIAFLGNGMNYPLQDIITKGLDAYYEHPFTLPVFAGQAVELPNEILKKLEGNYTSANYSEKYSLVIREGVLHAQTRGHKSYPLTAYANGSFRFDPVGLEIKFEGDIQSIVPDQFVLHQRGVAFKFIKD